MNQLNVFLKLSFLFVCFFPIKSLSDDSLKVKIIGMGETGNEKFLSNLIEVKVTGLQWNDKKTATQIRESNDGILYFPNPTVEPGGKITVNVVANGWEMLEPTNGVFYRPYDLNNEVVAIKMVTNQSRVNLSSLAGSFTNIYHSDSDLQYYVQVMASKSLDGAVEVQQTLINNQFKNATYIEAQRADLPDMDKLYKVIVGPFESRKSAEDSLAKIESLGAFEKPFIMLH
ncbi:SPOR domain-containing protein [Thiothrix winogradskyi]|uniref:SPOR domain-containing protein n=1 Tax=Thiothrix winogradskyi TaxID=96472 RepID=A0ABY3T358_9GAMM|nr:SPOR domain-containing protein [Thiothrix winogradskyi]UJS25230.1 SPOR domain-containing protein [Thiothrix winogradskyi]